MNDIRRVVSRAGRRLFAVVVIERVVVCLSAAVAALIVLRIAEQVLGVPVAGLWVRAAIAAAGAAIFVAIVWAIATRLRGLGVAREVDRRADLRESLGTAMLVASSPDPWARLIVENAGERARRLDVRQVVPIKPPSAWWLPFALALALGIVWMLPINFDLFGRQRQRAAEKHKVEETKLAQAEVQADQKKLEDLLAKAKVEMKGEEKAGQTDVPPPTDAEQVRRAAVKRLTDMQDRLSELQGGAKGEQMKAIEQAMKQLKQPGPGPMDELSKALARSDFSKAREELSELNKKLADGSMSKDEQQQMKAQLNKLAEQIDKAAADRKELERQLQQAGMSPDQAAKAAADSAALKDAIEKLKNLSPEQKKKLMEQAQSQREAGGKCESMSDAMKQMAQGMNMEGLSQSALEGMASLDGELSELEMMKAESASLRAAMKEAGDQLKKLAGQCKGGECDGDGKLAMSMKRGEWGEGETAGRKGNGSGGPGQSGGGISPEGTDADASIEKVKSKTKPGGGPIIGSRQVWGQQVRGESTAEFGEAVEASAKAASTALESTDVPREFHEPVKHYFSAIEAKAKKKAAPAATSTTAPAPAPASPAAPPDQK